MNKANVIHNNNELIEILLDLLKEVCEAIMEVYEKPYSEVNIKEDNSPVTQADLTANRILNDGLINLFPEIPIVSE